jgi:hypothetical protein
MGLAIISIKSPEVREETVGSNTFRRQAAMLVEPGPDGIRLPFDLSLSRGQQPYQPGQYTFGAGSFKQGRFKALEFDPYSIELVPQKVGA